MRDNGARTPLVIDRLDHLNTSVAVLEAHQALLKAIPLPALAAAGILSRADRSEELMASEVGELLPRHKVPCANVNYRFT
jgi:hypothetical protein